MRFVKRQCNFSGFLIDFCIDAVAIKIVFKAGNNVLPQLLPGLNFIDFFQDLILYC